MLQGGVEQDYIGACRVFGISDKLIFEQLTRLDDEEMVMCEAPKPDAAVASFCPQR